MPNTLPEDNIISKTLEMIKIMSSNKFIGKKREKNLTKIKNTLDELSKLSSNDISKLKCAFLIEAGLIYSAIDDKVEAKNYFIKALDTSCTIFDLQEEDIKYLQKQIQGQIVEIE